MSNVLNVGVDISMRNAAVSFLSQEGNYLGKTFEVPNNPSFISLRYLLILALCSPFGFSLKLIIKHRIPHRVEILQRHSFRYVMAGSTDISSADR